MLVYRAVVLTTLLYGAETWPVKAEHLRRLNSFHHACLRTILGISRCVQWEEPLSSATLGKLFGMDHDIAIVLQKYRLRWLGHVARMEDSRLPKSLLFGELPHTRPPHGPKKRWRDIIVSDLASIGLTYSTWYEAAQDRKLWWARCQEQQERPRPPRVICPSCRHDFSCPSDLKRHQTYCKADK